ncbi:MAG: conjugative transfer protein [Lachnospiraceae bacterium]|nr:conjugative transfer protein [Lachnospiraceae bacterium]
MEFFNIVLQFASMAVTGFGGAIAIGGIIDFGEGKSQQAAAKQSEGMTKIVGGGIIIAVGIFLVPQLSSLLTV